MKKLGIFLLAIFLMGCDFAWKNEVDDLKAKSIEKYESAKETVEGVKNDITEMKETVEGKIEDINEAMDAINDAKDAVDKAFGSDDDETEASDEEGVTG